MGSISTDRERERKKIKKEGKKSAGLKERTDKNLVLVAEPQNHDVAGSIFRLGPCRQGAGGPRVFHLPGLGTGVGVPVGQQELGEVTGLSRGPPWTPQPQARARSGLNLGPGRLSES